MRKGLVNFLFWDGLSGECNLQLFKRLVQQADAYFLMEPRELHISIENPEKTTNQTLALLKSGRYAESRWLREILGDPERPEVNASNNPYKEFYNIVRAIRMPESPRQGFDFEKDFWFDSCITVEQRPPSNFDHDALYGKELEKFVGTSKPLEVLVREMGQFLQRALSERERIEKEAVDKISSIPGNVLVLYDLDYKNLAPLVEKNRMVMTSHPWEGCPVSFYSMMVEKYRKKDTVDPLLYLRAVMENHVCALLYFSFYARTVDKKKLREMANFYAEKLSEQQILDYRSEFFVGAPTEGGVVALHGCKGKYNTTLALPSPLTFGPIEELREDLVAAHDGKGRSQRLQNLLDASTAPRLRAFCDYVASQGLPTPHHLLERTVEFTI